MLFGLDMVTWALLLMIALAVVRHLRRHWRDHKVGAVVLAVIGAGAVLNMVLLPEAGMRYAGPIVFFLADFFLTGRARRLDMLRVQVKPAR